MMPKDWRLPRWYLPLLLGMTLLGVLVAAPRQCHGQVLQSWHTAPDIHPFIIGGMVGLSLCAVILFVAWFTEKAHNTNRLNIWRQMQQQYQSEIQRLHDEREEARAALALARRDVHRLRRALRRKGRRG